MSEEPDVAEFLIVGLGNPGRHFRGNRHNAGYMLVDYLLDAHGASLNRSVGEALVAEIEFNRQAVVLAKPQTYMNESGRSVASLVRAFDVELSRLMIAFDELDLELGTLRMRAAGGSSGHRGMRSIINHLGTQAFPRLRIGIGRPSGRQTGADYVLTNFSSAERDEAANTLDRAVGCIHMFIESGIEKAMTECNRVQDS